MAPRQPLTQMMFVGGGGRMVGPASVYFSLGQFYAGGLEMCAPVEDSLRFALPHKHLFLQGPEAAEADPLWPQLWRHSGAECGSSAGLLIESKAALRLIPNAQGHFRLAMGCCSSSDPPYNPHFRAQQGDPVRPKDAGFLPFVRWDTAAVAPQIKGGDHIYLIFTYSEAAIEGNEDGTVTAEVPAIPSKWPWAWLGGGSTEADRQEFRGSCIFRVWRKDGTNSVVQDGDDVFFEHVNTGKYLEASTDTEPLALTDKDENASGQLWGFFKQGRPMEMRHRDNVYIQSWLHNYVEYRYFEDSNLYAKRWQRREPQTLTILKKAVLDSSTTEVARKFQF
eukprot:s5485_g2.t1